MATSSAPGSTSASTSTRFSWRTVGPSLLTWGLCLLFFGPFLIYPVGRVLASALLREDFKTGAKFFDPRLLILPLQDDMVRQSIFNSFALGVSSTLLASIIALPLAYASARLKFAGKSALTGLLLVPLLLPPLVGAVGLSQILAREGFVNTLLHRNQNPIDFLGGAPLLMIVLVTAFHLYPLIYLNVSAAWANIDSSLEEAAENQGATTWGVFRTVTLPLLVPGFLSGALIVFIFAFTDLGTPLVFNFRQVAAVKIYDMREAVSDPTGYVLALYLVILSGFVFYLSRRFLSGERLATLARGTRRARESTPPWPILILVYAYFGLVIGTALVPHVGVIMASLAHDWTSRLWPQWTTENYWQIFHSSSIPAASSIKISIICALASMSIDVVGGFFLAYALVRGKVWAKGLLDTMAMLPLALPGLILAFGLLISFRYTQLDPLVNPIPLLIASYAVRRLPYALRSVSGGLQQMSVALEEASLNMGATPVATMWQITRPLVTANLIAAGLLTFAFAVLEVSDSLILAANKDYSPIAAAILLIMNMGSSGTYPACALGVVGMVLLAVTFLCVNKLLGKQMGSLFRT